MSIGFLILFDPFNFMRCQGEGYTDLNKSAAFDCGFVQVYMAFCYDQALKGENVFPKM